MNQDTTNASWIIRTLRALKGQCLQVNVSCRMYLGEAVEKHQQSKEMHRFWSLANLSSNPHSALHSLYYSGMVCNLPVHVSSIFKMVCYRVVCIKHFALCLAHSRWSTDTGSIPSFPKWRSWPQSTLRRRACPSLTVIFFPITYPSSTLHSAPQSRAQRKHQPVADFIHYHTHISLSHMLPSLFHLISRPLRIWSSISSALTGAWFLRAQPPSATSPWVPNHITQVSVEWLAHHGELQTLDQCQGQGHTVRTTH